MSFTKGPWKVLKHEHIHGDLWLSVINGAWDITSNGAAEPGVIADARYSAMSDEENLANAHLIAAAPELYWVCKYIEEDGLMFNSLNRDVAKMLQAALAKAEGKT